MMMYQTFFFELTTYNFRLKTSHERMKIKNDLRWIYKTAQEDVGLGMVH